MEIGEGGGVEARGEGEAGIRERRELVDTEGLVNTPTDHAPVKNGSSSPRVLSSPRAKAMVESFLMEFRRSCAWGI